MASTAVDTWDLVPDVYPTVISIRRRAVRSPFEGAMIHRRQTFSSESAQGQAAVRQFRLPFTNSPKSYYNRAVTLWKKTLGGALTLSWSMTATAYSGTENILVRMVAAPQQFRKLGHGRYAFEIVLEEVLHAP